MQPGDLIKIKTRLYWFGDRPKPADIGCLALVLELSEELDGDAHRDAVTLAAMGGSSHGARLMIDGIPYWIRLKATDVEVINDTD